MYKNFWWGYCWLHVLGMKSLLTYKMEVTIWALDLTRLLATADGGTFQLQCQTTEDWPKGKVMK